MSSDQQVSTQKRRVIIAITGAGGSIYYSAVGIAQRRARCGDASDSEQGGPHFLTAECDRTVGEVRA